jgi:hypothetical protein
MARQNNIPKGAGPHLRPPNAAHDPSAPGQAYGSAYPHQQYDAYHDDEQPTLPGGAPRDIFSALRPESPSLSSRFEPFAPPAGRPQAQGGFGRQGYGEADDQSYGAHGHDPHDPYARPLPGGYPAQGGYGGSAGAEHDQHYYGQQPQHGHAPQGHYGQEDAYAYDDPYRPDAADPYASGQHLGAGQGADGGYYEDEYADEPEAPARRGPRAIVVVGALIGAIALGGGLAYAYKAMTNGGRESGKLPILRADSAPTKAQPAEPGGKRMAHTDKKFINRLDEGSGPARPVPVSIHPPAPERESADGPRRVPTMIVNRDGTIASSAAAPPPSPPSSGVPGLLVDGLTPRMPPPQREVAPPPQRAQPIEPPAPAVPPRRVASAPPVAAVEPPPAATPPPPPRPQAEARRPVPRTRQAARTPPSAPAPSTAAAPSAGYVAVLVSRTSHMDALKSLADIQQKHPGILQGRAADVRQANLGEKGVWYRVVVGPPGSRESANSVCGRLKSEGYSGCWIMSY